MPIIIVLIGSFIFYIILIEHVPYKKLFPITAGG